MCPYHRLHHLRMLMSQFVDDIVDIHHIIILHLFQYNIQSNEGPSMSTKVWKYQLHYSHSVLK